MSELVLYPIMERIVRAEQIILTTGPYLILKCWYLFSLFIFCLRHLEIPYVIDGLSKHPIHL